MAKINYSAGDTIQYNSYGEIRTILVEEKSDDIKNGRPGFDGTCTDPNPGQSVWGYDDQIIRVVSRGAKKQ